jgi:phosphohistidine phosphatase
MDCILLRHGIAVEPDEWEGTDAERPLTHGGGEKTREALRGLLRLDVAPTHILSSPYVRARETAELARSVLAVRSGVDIRSELVPEAHPGKLLTVLAGLPADACVLCVGHEPNLGGAAGVMLFGDPVAALSLKKAGPCCVRFSGPPTAAGGVLRWWLMPSQLRRLGRA